MLTMIRTTLKILMTIISRGLLNFAANLLIVSYFFSPGQPSIKYLIILLTLILTSLLSPRNKLTTKRMLDHPITCFIQQRGFHFFPAVVCGLGLEAGLEVVDRSLADLPISARLVGDAAFSATLTLVSVDDAAAAAACCWLVFRR